MNGRNNVVPAMQPQMQAVTPQPKLEDLVGCPCGGLAVGLPCYFLQPSLIVGQQTVAVAMLPICNSCGEAVVAPFKKRQEIKEALAL